MHDLAVFWMLLFLVGLALGVAGSVLASKRMGAEKVDGR
jgi:Na+-driven multidrug efflux pump